MKWKTHPIVAVIWDDAHGDLNETDDSEIEHDPVPIVSYGLLVKDDEKGITLFSEQTGESSYRGRGFIPRGMVRDVIQLRKTSTSIHKRIK